MTELLKVTGESERAAGVKNGVMQEREERRDRDLKMEQRDWDRKSERDYSGKSGK